MAQISVNNLTFSYDKSYDNIFENVSFVIDTDWKLGFIGRNGKGKTTFLKLLLGEYEYSGKINTSVIFDYFPYVIKDEYFDENAADFFEKLKPTAQLWRVMSELDKLNAESEVLYRPFRTLSPGERTKVMLAILFSGDNEFLLIDEPTNHLDYKARQNVKDYLCQKKGFILVSHDRNLLDACVNHVLVFNRESIEVENGNFSVWWDNKTKRDMFNIAENEKAKSEIEKLEQSSKRLQNWAAKNESTKIGFNPIKEHDRFLDTRAYIGAKTKKTQKVVKTIANRINKEIVKKEGLLNNIEKQQDLKLYQLDHYKENIVYAREYSLAYKTAAKATINNLTFDIKQGERIILEGKNGAGKSTLIKSIIANAGIKNNDADNKKIIADNTVEFLKMVIEKGQLYTAPGIVISYVNQDTTFLKGSFKDFCKSRELDESLLCAVLRQLDMERQQFEKNLENYSEGQKKKLLIATSLITKAHLYIWDEPLNYIDVFSRMQIEKLILDYAPTMLIVEHDSKFCDIVGTRIVEI